MRNDVLASNPPPGLPRYDRAVSGNRRAVEEGKDLGFKVICCETVAGRSRCSLSSMASLSSSRTVPQQLRSEWKPSERLHLGGQGDSILERDGYAVMLGFPGTPCPTVC